MTAVQRNTRMDTVRRLSNNGLTPDYHRAQSFLNSGTEPVHAKFTLTAATETWPRAAQESSFWLTGRHDAQADAPT